MESNMQPNPAPVSEPQIQYQNSYPTQTITPKKLNGWGTFMGVLCIISGAFSSMTIIMAIIGVPMIIAGVKLVKGVSLSQEITHGDPKTNEVFDNLNAYFKMNGIAFICSIVIGILGFIIIIAAAIAAGTNYFRGF